MASRPTSPARKPLSDLLAWRLSHDAVMDLAQQLNVTRGLTERVVVRVPLAS